MNKSAELPGWTPLPTRPQGAAAWGWRGESPPQTGPQPRRNTSNTECLEVFSFNDLHGQWGNLAAEAAWPRRLATLREARARSLLFGLGDDHAGGTIWDATMEMPGAGAVYPLLAASGVDALTLGNHDLDWGVPQLVEKLAATPALPVVATHLLPESPLAPVTWRALIFEVQGALVGVVAALNLTETREAHDHLMPPTCVVPWARAMHDLVDHLIVLSHLGTEADVTLAAQLPRDTLLLGSHRHEVRTSLPNTTAPRPAYLQAGHNGSHLGHARWTPQGWRTRAVPAQELPTLKPGPAEARAREALAAANEVLTPATPFPPLDQVPRWALDRLIAWVTEAPAPALSAVTHVLLDGRFTLNWPPRHHDYATWCVAWPYPEGLGLVSLTPQQWQALQREAKAAWPCQPCLQQSVSKNVPIGHHERVEVLTHAVVLNRAFGWDRVLKKAALDPDAWQPHWLPFTRRRVLWEMLKSSVH